MTLEITKGTLIRHEQAGGGGYGPPQERDIQRILADIADDKISAPGAS